MASIVESDMDLDIEGEAKLRLENLDKHFPVNQGVLARILRGESGKYVHAVDGVSLSIEKGESFGLAGESGCGKTTLGKTAIRLHEPTNGRIYFDGKDITDVTGKELKAFRREAQIIHQDPYESINPRFTTYEWVKEPLDVHDIGNREERDARVMRTLEMAGLEPAEAYATVYPSELSGGERQRVGIARALVLEPSFLLADEPASMLDVSIRASILDVFERLQNELGLTAVYISHDLSLLKHICDRIGIMYLGQLVEVGPANDIINDPQHPYTQALVSSVPRVDPDAERERIELVGEVSDAIDVPRGCRFNPRCPKLVQPKQAQFDESTWRLVANLRDDIILDDLALETDDIEQILSFYDIPEAIDDTEDGRIIFGALEHYLSGDKELAKEQIHDDYASPCESGPIPTYQTGTRRRAKCIRLDPNGPYDVAKSIESAN